MNALTTAPREVSPACSDRDVASRWKWRERTGAMVSPAEMQTRHLFFTLRMIWNNRMPAHMRVGRVHLYNFGPYYTRHYFSAAILAIGAELHTRTDMTAEWQAQYRQMQAWLVRDDGRLALRGATPEKGGR